MVVLREIRCPSCARLQFKLVGGVAWLEGKCRCKTMFVVHGMDTMPLASIASPSMTFGGVSYAGFGVGVR